MFYLFIAVLVVATVTALVRRRGYKLHSVTIYQCAASRGDDYVEITVGGCRLRKSVEVKADISRFHKAEALRRSIWASVKKYDSRVTAVRYQGHTYSF